MDPNENSSHYLTVGDEAKKHDQRRASRRETTNEMKSLQPNHVRIAMLFALGYRNTQVADQLEAEGQPIRKEYLSKLRNNELMKKRVAEFQEEMQADAIKLATGLAPEEHTQMVHDAMSLLGNAASGIVNTPLIDPETQEVQRDPDTGEIMFIQEHVPVRERLSAARVITATHKDTAPVQRVKPIEGNLGPNEAAVNKIKSRLQEAIDVEAKEVTSDA